MEFEYKHFLSARKFIESKSLSLMSHEGKDYAKVGFPPQNFRLFLIGERLFYVVSTNVFREIIRSVLPEACLKIPEKFGTHNALDVLKALYEVEPYSDFDSFIQFLGREQFCYVIENEFGTINERILRIDLFRKLDLNKDGNYDFTGGIFHCYKHFSFQGHPLSTRRELHDLPRPEFLIERITEAFFIHPGTEISKNSYSVKVDLDEQYILRHEFYYEEVTGVHFLKTVYKQKKPRSL